jgi:hypothetical protein
MRIIVKPTQGKIFETGVKIFDESSTDENDVVFLSATSPIVSLIIPGKVNKCEGENLIYNIKLPKLKL